jgi:hypothetical protein
METQLTLMRFPNILSFEMLSVSSNPYSPCRPALVVLSGCAENGMIESAPFKSSQFNHIAQYPGNNV